MISKTRLHKLVWDDINQQKLEYTKPEVQRNISAYGVYLNSELIFNRLEWVVNGAANVDFSHWPQRSKGDYENVKVIYKEDNLVVLFKPVGVVVEAGSGHKLDNLESWLNTEGKQILQLQNIQANLLPAHRLDKDTQGLIIFATQESLQNIQDQFRNRSTYKEYVAKVEEIVENITITEHYQTRSSFNPLRQDMFPAANDQSKLRHCKTTIYPLFVCTKLNQSIVRVRLYTGRMHQIRLVCEKLGFPLAADKIYNSNPDLKLFAKHATKPALNPIQDLSTKDFITKSELYFGDSEHGLLANHLRFESISGNNIDVEHIPLLNT
jgi:23S rRNA-/tRNA-specific pseudouridylate synthase